MLEMGTIRAQVVLFGWKIINDLSFSLSALLAYNILIALLPLILSMLAMASLVFRNDQAVMNFLRIRLKEVFPEQGVSEIVDALMTSLSHQAGIIFVTSFLVSIFTSSRLFVTLDDILTIIYRSPERSILNQNIHAIKMLLAFILITPFIIIISSIPALIKNNNIFYSLIISLSSGAVAFILISLIYYFVPERKMSWRNM